MIEELEGEKHSIRRKRGRLKNRCGHVRIAMPL